MIVKIRVEIIYKVSGGKRAFEQSPTLLHAAVSLLPPPGGVLASLPPPTSEPCAGTGRGDHELLQNHISLAVSRPSETVHSHWGLAAQGARGRLIIIILCIRRLLFTRSTCKH